MEAQHVAFFSFSRPELHSVFRVFWVVFEAPGRSTKHVWSSQGHLVRTPGKSEWNFGREKVKQERFFERSSEGVWRRGVWGDGCLGRGSEGGLSGEMAVLGRTVRREKHTKQITSGALWREWSRRELSAGSFVR